jgi:tRNA threonylcarbamoyladenosine biosynthesis protein TsaB
MEILGIDTTSRFLVLGIYDNGKIYDYTLEVGPRLSSLLALHIKRTLDALGRRVDDIDYFACGLGPGSFTGIRVGMATIKGLAWSLKKPLIGISTLDIIARNANIADGYIAPLIDAKRNLIYASIYRIKNNTLKRTAPYMLLTKEELFKKVKDNTVMFGDAIGLYTEDILRNIKGAVILGKEYWYPKAHNIVNLARERIKENKLDSAYKVQPVYLYPKECQIRK